jgi:carboxymethylenebutenolidase
MRTMPDTTIELSTPDGPMDVFEATPERDPRGAIIVIQEAFGVDDYVKDVSRRFAEAGYVAAAPAMFHRVGGGIVPYDDTSTLRSKFEGLTDDAILMDVDATIVHLRDLGFADGSIGTIGFCWGGRVTFLTALRRAIGAAVGFYGAGIIEPSVLAKEALIDEAGSLRTPWLGLFGDLDRSIPVAGVERLRDELRTASVPADVVRYPDAGHAFHNQGRDGYHEASAGDGWQRALDWFDAHLA